MSATTTPTLTGQVLEDARRVLLAGVLDIAGILDSSTFETWFIGDLIDYSILLHRARFGSLPLQEKDLERLAALARDQEEEAVDLLTEYRDDEPAGDGHRERRDRARRVLAALGAS